MNKLLLLITLVTFGISAKAQAVYTTPYGEKYHTSSCRYVRTKTTTKKITLSEAKTEGKEACKVCKPSGYEYTSNPTTNKQNTARQCSGRTQAGNRCKRKTKSSNGRCYQH